MTEGHQRDENRIRRSYLTELAQVNKKAVQRTHAIPKINNIFNIAKKLFEATRFLNQKRFLKGHLILAIEVLNGFSPRVFSSFR